MFKLKLENKQTITKDGKEMILDRPEYNISDKKLMIDNEFLQCDKCKTFTDVVYEFGSFHPKKDDKEYCKTCFESKL